MTDPFAVFNLPHQFDIDQADLRKRFVKASAAAHPDRFTDPVEQAEAAERSSEINEAHRILKDPEARANALLALLGGPAKEDDKSLPDELLMEMMEVREKQEEAEASGDAAVLKELADWARQQRAEHLDRIAQLLREDASGEDLKEARKQLNALRYFERMIEQSSA